MLEVEEQEVIVKYGNRKIYSKTRHEYLSLHDIELLVKSQKPYVILNHKTMESCEKEVLMAVLAKKEFSLDELRDLIAE